MTAPKWQSAATRPEMDEGLQYHIRCRRGDVERYVLLPGDPERVDLIAAEWTEARPVANYREHRTFTGRLDGVGVTCCSTGAGGGSTSSAFEELAVLGADTFIRVGTTGALQAEIECGDLIISTGAMRQDGTSQLYVDPAYPAAAHYAVTAALVEAAERLGVRYHVGVACSTGSWYCGQGRPGFRGYEQSFFRDKVDDLRRAGVLNFEMETATIFTLASLYGLRAGAVCTAVANRITDRFVYGGIEHAVRTANLAIQVLAGWDRRQAEAGKRHWYPSLTV
jgi:uridine phosphorylase